MTRAPRIDRERCLVKLEEEPIWRGSEFGPYESRDRRKRDWRARVGNRTELGAGSPRQQIDARRQVTAEAGEDWTEIAQCLAQAVVAVLVGAETSIGRRQAARRCRPAERLQYRLDPLPPALAVGGAVCRPGGRGHRFGRPSDRRRAIVKHLLERVGARQLTVGLAECQLARRGNQRVPRRRD